MALEFVDLGLGSDHLDYQATWDLQRAIHAEVSGGIRTDTVLLLEHSSVYTAGKRTEPHERPPGWHAGDRRRPGGGGKITWHGPRTAGGLSDCPASLNPPSLLITCARLEEAMIGMFSDYGLNTGRIRGLGCLAAAGLQRLERKIAAIGIRVAAGTTMHGFAINVNP